MRTNQQLFEEHRWEESPLGPVSGWPLEMRVVVETALASGFPVCTAWGPANVQIYNDAYNPIYGDKHPFAFGRPTAESWPEIAAFLEPALAQVRASRQALWFKEMMLPLAKHGRPEECYFDFSYSPVCASGGEVIGVMSIAVEKTGEVVFQRRQRTYALAAEARIASPVASVADSLRERLAANEADAAFAALFLADRHTHLPSEVVWAVRSTTAQVDDLRALVARRCRDVREVRQVDDGHAAATQGRCAAVVPLVGAADDLRAYLCVVPGELVPRASHLDFAQGLSDRLHALMHYDEARFWELGEVREAMKERDTFYRFLFENMGDAALYGATDGAPESDEFVLEANARACEMLGYSHDELLGMRRETLFFPGDAQLRAALRERERAKSFVGDMVVRARDGRAVAVEVSSKLLTLEDGSTRSVTVMRESAARLARERERTQRAKFDTMVQLTGGIAHDFNNLLTVILSSLETIETSLPGDSPARALAGDAILAGERAAALTSQLLSYARKQALNARVIDMDAFLHEVRGLLQSSLGEVNTLRLQPGAEGACCRVDPTQFTTALINLATNARDAMPGGGVVTLSTALVEFRAPQAQSGGRAVVEGRYVRLRFRDTGVGIPAEIQERIFEPFYTTKEIGRGTGLGLSMVQGFVNQTGGDVRVESRPGEGACFDLLFPLVAEGAHDGRGEVAPRAATGEVVLVAEDNALVRDQVRRMLEQSGFVPVTASDAREALALLEHDPRIAIALTDLVMPGTSGIELASELRRRRRGLPVVIMTGYADRPAVEDGSGERYEVLAKPFTRAALAAALLRQLH
jgi:PAS domain S-box-containing protein